MRVGSLQSPREYDGRLPPDAGCYLNLVIPRFEEPPEKKHESYETSTCKIIRTRVIKLHAIIFQNISKFTSETNQNRTLGGPWGGPTEPPRDRISPPCGGPWGHGPKCAVATLGGWPKGPMAPPSGEIHSREASLGGVYIPPVPPY